MRDKNGGLRFKRNEIVRYLLDNGGIDLNKLAMLPFSDEDREQFAQLIGYSVSGFSELDYVSDETYETASLMVKQGLTEEQARIRYLEQTLANVKAGLKMIVPDLFGISEEDLGD